LYTIKWEKTIEEKQENISQQLKTYDDVIELKFLNGTTVSYRACRVSVRRGADATCRRGAIACRAMHDRVRSEGGFMRLRLWNQQRRIRGHLLLSRLWRHQHCLCGLLYWNTSAPKNQV
ncbi:hypothetical protein Pfo_006733, partial [Paulownia fortunei]